VDQLAELVVGGLVVAVEGPEAGDLLLHLVGGGEPLLAGLVLLGLRGLLRVDLRLRLAALGLDDWVRESDTYLGLEHVRGVAVAHGDRRRPLERPRQLRVHLDQEVAVLRHLAVPREDALAAPVDERLADDGGADVDDPAARELVDLVVLGGQVLVHRLELREEGEDLRHREVLVLRDRQVAHGVRRDN
jgi:hypothetical protein